MTMATSTKSTTTVRRASAPRMLLAARAHIDLHEKGLTSVAGAHEIIASIRARKTVTKLILGHNALGDDGCQELFRFLCTEDGRRYCIAEISLNSNGIGDAGLEAIAEYLEGNVHLHELFLQNNAFEGGIDVALKLSSAINSSRLELLSLVTNQQLSDAFFTPFLSHLDSPTLRELQISALGLTRISAPALTEYCISPRARALDTLKCNGNSLGARAVRSLLATLHSSNFTLQKLEVHANGDFRPYGGGDNDINDEPEESAEEARTKWAESEQNLESLLVRNKLIRRKVHEQALALLSYARVLFLKSSQRKHPQLKPSASQSSLISNSSQQSLRSSSSPSSPSTFPFLALPIELQQQILALLAPSLSASQRARVFNFASNPATLSPALPTLRSSGSHTGCIPDPASLPFSSAAAAAASSDPASLPSPLQDIGGMGIGMGSLGFLPNAGSRASPCAGGKCMGAGGSVLCHRTEARMRWLAEVECTRFDADGRNLSDVMALFAP